MEEKLKNMLRLFLNSIRDYEHEIDAAITDDGRDSEEFVNIFIDSEDSFDYKDILSQLKERDEIRENQAKKIIERQKKVCELESQLKEKDKLLADIYSYIQDSDNDYFIAIRNRISNL
jgi:hypothetical protein